MSYDCESVIIYYMSAVLALVDILGVFYALNWLQYVQNWHWRRPDTSLNNSLRPKAISVMYMPILKIYLLRIANLLKQVYQVYFAISKHKKFMPGAKKLHNHPYTENIGTWRSENRLENL